MSNDNDDDDDAPQLSSGAVDNQQEEAQSLVMGIGDLRTSAVFMRVAEPREGQGFVRLTRRASGGVVLFVQMRRLERVIRTLDGADGSQLTTAFSVCA